MIRKFLFALALAALSLAAHAADARLFGTADFVSPAGEAAALTADERTAVAKARALKGYGAVQAVRVSASSLYGRTVLLTLPDGQTVECAGSPSTLAVPRSASDATPTEYKTWTGASRKGEVSTFLVNAEGTAGLIRANGKAYYLMPLPGQRYSSLAEVIPSPEAWRDDTPKGATK